MKRSESDLRQAIATSPHEINDRDNAGSTALHFSVHWPTGVLILVEAGADVDCVTTLDSISLLELAIRSESVDVLRILGEADCSFVKESNSRQWYYLETMDPYSRDLFPPGRLSSSYTEWSTESAMMAQLLVDFIANRRQRLRDLAFEKVPSSVLTHLLPTKTDEPYIIDEKASRLALELASRGITVPPPLNPGKFGETGYHAIGGQPKIAEILWKTGFRDVNGKDSCNMTPLMCCPIGTLLRFIGWCLGKGFRLNLDVEQDRAWYRENADNFDEFRPGQPLETESIYCKIYALGSGAGYLSLHSRSFMDFLVSSETDQQLAQKIFMASPTDGCKCACSISGCTTRTFLFKGFSISRRRQSSESLSAHDIIKFCSDPKDVYSWLDAAELLRFITFEKLDLTHTCCRPHWSRHIGKSQISVGNKQRETVRFSRPMPPSEIEEIRDEESANLQTLAELLAEFEVKMVELDLSILDFISRYWEPRMEQLHRENEGSLDMEALREIGVNILPSEKPAVSEGWALM